MREAASNGRSSRFFWFACAAEAALLIVAFVIAWLVDHPLYSDLHWSVDDFLLGLAAAAPLFFVFWWMLRSSIEPLARIRRLLVSGLRPLFAPWSLLQLGIISVLAGLCEEVLFRSVIQGALSVTAGPVTALIVASALFGAVHLVTLTYAVIAAVIGAYLGALWLWSGNLLLPITAHAAYDFVALVCFLRFWEPESPSED